MVTATFRSLIVLVLWLSLRSSLWTIWPASACLFGDFVVGVLCLPAVSYVAALLLFTKGLDSSRTSQLICFSVGLGLMRISTALDAVNKLIPGNPFAQGAMEHDSMVGAFYHAMENRDAAAKHAKWFIKKYRYAPNSFECLSRSYLMLAELEMHKGNYAEAKKFADESLLAIESNTQSPGSKGAAMADLCASYMKMGLIKESIEIGTKAVDTFDPGDPLQHQLQAIAYNNLGLAYSYAGNYQQAYNCAKRAFNLKVAANPEPNVSRVISHVNLSESLLLLERYEEALQEARLATSILDKLGFADNLIRATALQNVGAALVGLNRPEEAKTELEAARKSKKKHMAAKDPEWHSMHLDFAKLHSALNEQALAEKDFSEAMAIVAKQLGDQHPRFAYCAVEYAKFLDKNGRADEAAAMRAQADDIQSRYSSK